MNPTSAPAALHSATRMNRRLPTAAQVETYSAVTPPERNTANVLATLSRKMMKGK